MTDSDIMDKERPRYEKGRQESIIESVNDILGVIDRIPENNLSDIEKNFKNFLNKSYINMQKEHKEY
jgi:hypothetical protein